MRSNAISRTFGHTPLIKAIISYRDSAGMLDARDDPASAAGAELAASFAVLEDWAAPAETLEAALSAMRLAIDEAQAEGASVALSMMVAALGYFERGNRA